MGFHKMKKGKSAAPPANHDSEIAMDIERLHRETKQLLFKWIDEENLPTSKREKQALALLADAEQNLSAAYINISLADAPLNVYDDFSDG
jgi:hypothetical protein